MGFKPIKVIDLELTEPLYDVRAGTRYGAVRALVRLQGAPLGSIELPLDDGVVSVRVVAQTIYEHLAWPLARQYLLDQFAQPLSAPVESVTWPALSVIVCTRNRPADLATCLESLLDLEYPGDLEVIVVDNAPADDRSARLVQERFSGVHYVREERPGLNRARNRGVAEARYDIVAFVDDDVVVDRSWARALARVFVRHPGVMAVTGLVAPLELETAAQAAFEHYGGFGRGYIRRWAGVNRAGGERAATEHIAVARFGTGANMAYRRGVFSRVGGFDPALDVGTPTSGGGDLEMFFRVLKAGYPLVYEPEAIARHRHRREAPALRAQITNNGVGLYAFLARCFWHFPEERLPVARHALWWFLYWFVWRLVRSFFQPINTSRALVLAEWRGALSGPWRYWQARRAAIALATPGDPGCTIVAPAQTEAGLRPHGAAIRVVDLDRPIGPLEDVRPYPETLVLARRGARLLGYCQIRNCYQPIGADRLREALVDQLRERLLEEAPSPPAPAGDMALTVVIACHGATSRLHHCLHDLLAQRTGRPMAIIVVHHGPELKRLRHLAAEWGEVRVIAGSRPGAIAAWNAGIAMAATPLVALSDEHTRFAPDWAERITAPFADPAVGAVVGNLFPEAIETKAQRLHTRYAGLGRGFTGARLSSASAPLPGWSRGSLIGVALRRTALPAASEEWLREGPCPAARFFTRQLASGNIVVYNPDALAWHPAAPTLRAVMGEVWRAGVGRHSFGAGDAGRLAAHLAARLADLVRGRDEGMLLLSLVEVAGMLAGRGFWKVFTLPDAHLQELAEGRNAL